METSATHTYTDNTDTIKLAFRHLHGDQKGSSKMPGLVWLGGFKSDMTGTKAQAMVECAQDLSTSSLRFDYSGHGESEGKFVDGTISKWVAQSLDIIRQRTNGPQVLVGSSMGGWIALRVVEELRKSEELDRVHGLCLIAPAPDFTELLMKPAFSVAQRNELDNKGFISESSEYSDEPTIITKQLIDDGTHNLVLDQPIQLDASVRILQGMQDPDVPYEHALKLVDNLAHDDVTLTLIKEGDHRLSRDEDIELLKRTLKELVTQ